MLLRLTNRLYRRLKTWFLLRPPFLLTALFFRAQTFLDRRLGHRRKNLIESSTDRIWRQTYLIHFAKESDHRWYVRTDHPLAFSSDDHLLPRGAISDNSRNARFNVRLYDWLKYPEGIHLLDLGCAGGGFVRSLLEDGHAAIGLEGSDAAKRSLLGEWGNIPHHLFTCDITRDFSVVDKQGTAVVFDVVTAWEVLEHIAEEQIHKLLGRISHHLRPGGLLICSIDLLPDGNPLTGAIYHKTLKDATWWRAAFSSQGFDIIRDHPFATADFVRGNGGSLKDWFPDEKTGIHIVARSAPRT